MPARADRERALAAGFREHLAKPVNPDVLLQTLEDLLAEERRGRSERTAQVAYVGKVPGH